MRRDDGCLRCHCAVRVVVVVVEVVLKGCDL